MAYGGLITLLPAEGLCCHFMNKAMAIFESEMAMVVLQALMWSELTCRASTATPECVMQNGCHEGMRYSSFSLGT